MPRIFRARVIGEIRGRTERPLKNLWPIMGFLSSKCPIGGGLLMPFYVNPQAMATTINIPLDTGGKNIPQIRNIQIRCRFAPDIFCLPKYYGFPAESSNHFGDGIHIFTRALKNVLYSVGAARSLIEASVVLNDVDRVPRGRGKAQGR
jgi:hypothetical protein